MVGIDLSVVSWLMTIGDFIAVGPAKSLSIFHGRFAWVAKFGLRKGPTCTAGG